MLAASVAALNTASTHASTQSRLCTSTKKPVWPTAASPASQGPE